MALSDVTAEGVKQALLEFDQLGRDAFLERYGFGKARRYFLFHEGHRYDSKAVVGVAHGYDLPDIGPLRPQDFSGGYATVGQLLESLGFNVEWDSHNSSSTMVKKHSRNPDWAEEELILALDLYLRSGVLSSGHPDVQELSCLLRSMSIHPVRPDPERFRNPSGVNLKLANFAAIDPNYDGRGMRRGGKRVAEVWERYASDEDALIAAASALREGYGHSGADPAESTPGQVEEVAVEAQHVEQFPVSPPDHANVAHPKERSLVQAYSHYLENRDHIVTRYKYTLDGSNYALYCDLVDKTCHVLYEAKGDVLRTSVRMAIGQLLDYRRFEKTIPKMNLAVLLPRKPAQDLIKLIHSVPASVVWRTNDGFECCEPSADDISRALQFLRDYEAS